MAKAYNDCYALPSAQRVTARDANGLATAIAPICNFVPANYKSNGYTWIEQQSGALSNPNLDGALAQRPLVSLVLPAQNRTGAKEFKHPYCNQAQCVLVDLRSTLPAASNQPLRRDILLAKTAAGWQPIGNQRPYDFDIQLRFNRLVNTNAAPLNAANYFSISRYEANLRTLINPSWPGMNGVRAARVTGPGLPALGVVLSRSTRCTSDRLAIVSKTGDTFVVDNGVNVARYYTGNASNDFKVEGANLDGSVPAAWPSANVDYADALGGAAQLVPYGVYKWEFFNFGSATPAEADLIVYQRLIVSNTDLNRFVDTPAPWWASVAASNVDDYLKPTGIKAGALTDVSLAWTVPASLGRVDGTYIFAQNNALVNAVSYNKRTLLSPVLAKPGDTTASITGGQTPWLSGVSTSTFTSGIVAAQNPRCGEADKSLVGITGVAGRLPRDRPEHHAHHGVTPGFDQLLEPLSGPKRTGGMRRWCGRRRAQALRLAPCPRRPPFLPRTGAACAMSTVQPAGRAWTRSRSNYWPPACWRARCNPLGTRRCGSPMPASR